MTLEIFFSRTTGPISTKFGTKHTWVNGVKVVQLKGCAFFPRGGNYLIAKIHWQNINTFCRTTGQIYPSFAVSSLKWQGFKIVQMKGHTHFQGELIQKSLYTLTKFKNLFQNHWDSFNQTLQKAPLRRGLRFVQIKNHAILKKKIMCFFYS